MNIAILGLTATSYGSLSYWQNIVPRLLQLDHTDHYEIFLPATRTQPRDGRQSNFHLETQSVPLPGGCIPLPDPPPPNYRFHQAGLVARSGSLRVLWEQLILPWILRARHVDAVFTTHNMAILLSPIPSITILQNVEPFFAGQYPSALRLRPRLWLLRKMTELSLRRSHKIIAISEWEKEFLMERFRVPTEKIVVSYPGVTEGFHPPASGSSAALRQHLGLEPPYILSVTRLAGYGNFLNLVKAYVALVKTGKVTMPLVVPGEVWDSQYIERAKKLLAEAGCADRVKFMGYVPHQHMPLLFGNATCFVFPSLLEACGTVLIEALACGTPILCCRRRPMSDICGDAAVLFDGEDSADIADRMYEVLSSPSQREELSRRAVERATQFGWQQGAEKVLRIFRELAPAPCAASPNAETIPPERRT